jgi:hypothetical protein
LNTLFARHGAREKNPAELLRIRSATHQM